MMLLSVPFVLAVFPAYIAAFPSRQNFGSGSQNNSATKSILSASIASPNASATSSLLGPVSYSSNSLLGALFPKGVGLAMWSTAVGAVDGAVPLSLDDLHPFSVSQSAPPRLGTAPDGSPAIQIHFLQGAYAYRGPAGGVSFYSNTGIDLSSAKEITSSYSVMFSEGFQFNIGGKLPGLYGGSDPSTDISCSGGRRDATCFSIRFMWRQNGEGELYTYLPSPSMGPQFSGNDQLCHVQPLSTCNSVYGASVGRGSWSFTPGQWTVLSQRVKLNDAGVQNGELEVIIDGQSVFNLQGLALRDSDQGRLDGYIFQSFFGGHDPSWASPQDQDIYIKDLSIAIIANL